MTEALSTVVAVRSNSRVSGFTSCDSETKGSAAANAWPTRALMRGIGIGMEERDGDAFHAGRLDAGHRVGDRGVVGRQHGRAGMIDTLGQADAPIRRHLRGAARRQVEAIEVLASAAADIEHVLEAARRHQRHRIDPVLDDGVGDQGGAVDEVVDFLGREAGGGEGGQDAGDGIVALGRHLDRPDFAARRQQGHQVGEGAADVDADLPATCRHLAKPFCHPSLAQDDSGTCV